MTCNNTPKCKEPCGDCTQEWPVPAGSEVGGERAKFEAAKLRTDCFPRIDIDMATATDEQIFAAIDEIAWRAWQARAALPNVQPKHTATPDDIDAQDWAGMDGATAYQLIERHGEDWSHIGRLMAAWLAANTTQSPAPVAGDYKQAPGSKNCMQSAVAYMLGLPMDAVPDFEKAGPDAWESFYAFFSERGFTAEMFPPNVEIDGDYLASGSTERGTSHMVVMRGGELLHDPHPSNSGLTSPKVVWVIARKAGPYPAVVAELDAWKCEQCEGDGWTWLVTGGHEPRDQVKFKCHCYGCDGVGWCGPDAKRAAEQAQPPVQGSES